MKLNLSQLRSVTLGAERVEETDRGFVFYRFTEEQLALYQDHRTRFEKTARTTSGIKLRFRTDSSILGLKGMTSKGGSRTYFSFELFVDGEKKDSFGNFSLSEEKVDVTREYPLGDFEKEFYLGEGEKEVILYFPWSVQAVLTEVTLSDGATITPVKPLKRLLCFGDSITQGYDAAYPSASYISRLARELGMEEYNKAIGGEIFFPALADTEESFAPDLITVAYGTNDWSHCTLAEYEKNCKLFYENLARRYPKIQILALTPIWRKPDEQVREMGDFDNTRLVIERVAESLPNVTVLCGIDFLPHREDLFADGRLHPNDEGFAHYAASLYREISATKTF